MFTKKMQDFCSKFEQEMKEIGVENAIEMMCEKQLEDFELE